MIEPDRDVTILFTRNGMVKVKNARYRDDPRPVEEGCPCPLCQRHSRAFIHHLFGLFF